VSTWPSLKIVLAEDNPHEATLVGLALQGAGLDFDLHVLSDGGQALSFIGHVDRDSAPLNLVEYTRLGVVVRELFSSGKDSESEGSPARLEREVRS